MRIKFWMTVFVVIALLFSLSYTLFPVINSDIWLHLASGREMISQRSILDRDPFSFTKYGQKWINHQWLSQLLLYAVYELAGTTGLIFLRAVIVLSFLYFSFKTAKVRGSGNVAPVIALILLFFLSHDRLVIRPHLFSALCMSILLYLMTRALLNQISNAAIALVVLILWVNLHGGVIWSQIMVIAFLVGLILGKITGTTHPVKKYNGKSSIFNHHLNYLYATLMFFAILINPFTWQLPLSILRFFAIRETFSVIKEWTSPFLYFEDLPWTGFVFLMLYFMVIIAFTYNFRNLTQNREKLPLYLFDVIIFVPASYLYFTSQRIRLDFAILTFPLLSEGLTNMFVSFGEKRQLKSELGNDFIYGIKNLKPYIISGKILISLIMMIGIIYNFSRSDDLKVGFGKGRLFSDNSIRFIAENKIYGKLLNSYELGGFLIFADPLKNKVFIDARVEFFGPELLKEYLSLADSEEQFHQIMEKYAIDWLYLKYPEHPNSKEKNIHLYLSNSENWALVYFDYASLIYLRRIDRFFGIIKAYEYRYLNPVAFDLSEFQKNAPEEIIPEVERGFKASNFPWLKTLIGVIYSQTGDYERAEMIFNSCIKDNPSQADVYFNLGMVYYQTNRIEQAITAFEKGLNFAPTDVDARLMLSKLLKSKGDLAGAEKHFRIAQDIAERKKRGR